MTKSKSELKNIIKESVDKLDFLKKKLESETNPDKKKNIEKEITKTKKVMNNAIKGLEDIEEENL